LDNSSRSAIVQEVSDAQYPLVLTWTTAGRSSCRRYAMRVDHWY
jgi:hypothetical protein